MRKLLLLVVLAIMFSITMLSLSMAIDPKMILPSPSGAVDVLDDNMCYEIKELYLYGIIEEMGFLEKTRPANWEAMLEDLRKLKYVPGDQFEKEMKLSEFYEKGGDCDDFAMYTVARLFQLGRVPGVLLLEPAIPQMLGHIAALTQSLDKETILVIDATLENKKNIVIEIKKYLTALIMSGQYKACRIIWFYPRSTPSGIFRPNM